MTFEEWWKDYGSGITPTKEDDMESHARRVSELAWDTVNEINNLQKPEPLEVGNNEISGERSYNADGTLPLQPEPDDIPI